MDAAHPQVAVDRAGHTAVVWDEPQGDHRVVMMRMSPVDSGHFDTPRVLSEGEAESYPFIVPAAGGFPVAWTGGPSEKSAIVVRQVSGLLR